MAHFDALYHELILDAGEVDIDFAMSQTNLHNPFSNCTIAFWPATLGFVVRVPAP
jgi:hypothetical protein